MHEYYWLPRWHQSAGSLPHIEKFVAQRHLSCGSSPRGHFRAGGGRREWRGVLQYMDGGLQGAASAFWSTASQGEVVSLFRHLGEDVSEPDSAALQVAGRLAFERLPRLANRAMARHLGGESFPFVSPPTPDWGRRAYKIRDLPTLRERVKGVFTGVEKLSNFGALNFF